MRLEETVECHGEALNRFVKCRCGEELVIEGIIQSAQNVVEGITEREAFAEAAKIARSYSERYGNPGDPLGVDSMVGREACLALAHKFEARAKEGA